MIENNPKKWYARKEVWGTVLTVISFSPEIINSFVTVGILPEYTLAAKLALPLGVILTIFGLRKGYKANNLYRPIDNIITDNLPEGMRRK